MLVRRVRVVSRQCVGTKVVQRVKLVLAARGGWGAVVQGWAAVFQGRGAVVQGQIAREMS